MSKRLPKILITGAGGFIGRPLVAALAGRAEIVPAQIDGRRANLLDEADRARLIGTAPAEILIHLAWETAHGTFWSAPSNEDWFAASVDLFARFYAAGGRRIIGTGSCAEYDWTTGATRFAETAPLAPHTAYGAAKVRTAQALGDLAQRHGAAWAWARIFFGFGPGEPAGRLIPLILRAVRDRQPLGIGPAGTVRDFCPAGQIAGGIAALALSDVEGPVNVAGGTGFHFSDLAQIANALAGVEIVQTDQRSLGPGEPPVLVADVARLRTMVGFDPAVSLEADLRRYFQAAFQ